MKHNHDGFWNFKNLVESILDDVSDIGDYSYHLSDILIMIGEAYRDLKEKFPKGISYKDTENITIEWGSYQSGTVVYLEDKWVEGIKLQYIIDKGDLTLVSFDNYISPANALSEVLYSCFIEDK